MTDRRLRGIYAILDATHNRDLERLAVDVLAAGVTVVQYRSKSGFSAQVTRRLRELTRAAGALLIVNDDLDAALACDADGVHLGQEDLAATTYERVRDDLGARIVGLSCGTPDEAREAVRLGVDYVGAGPCFATATKRDAGEPIGLAGLAAIVAAVTVPVAAIGGIALENVPSIARSGAAMAAVISAIGAAADSRAATERLIAAWRGAR